MSAENTGAAPAPAAPAAPAPVAPAAAPPAPAVAQAPPPSAPVPVAPAPAPMTTTQTMVTIPLEQVQAFMSIQTRLAEVEAAQRSQQEAAQREQATLLVQKGQLEDGLRMLREQSEQQLKTVQDSLTQTRSQASNYAIDVEVARALSGHIFANDKARRAFETEVRSELVAEAHGNTFAVRTPTFQSAEQLVNVKLANPDYAFLLAPKGVVQPAAPAAPASSGANSGPAPAAQTQPPANPRPGVETRNLGEAIIKQQQANVAARATSSNPALDTSRSFGLTAAPPSVR